MTQTKQSPVNPGRFSFPYRTKHALKVSSILGSQLERCMHRPTLTGVGIHDGEHRVAASPEQAILDKIHAPDVVRIQGTHSDDGMSMII